MVFGEPIFLFLFLPVLLAVYLAAPQGARNAVLLVASVAFYAYGEGKYSAVLLGSILLNYAFGRLVEATHPARGALAIGIAANLAGIFVFKYAGFATEELNRALAWAELGALPVYHLHLPLGISFFAFQGISYLVDVHRREVVAERSLFRFALFKAVFPQLIAGPIVRYVDVARQLHARHVTLEGVSRGSERFVIGLAKKLLLANPVGRIADDIFALPQFELSTPLAWLGLVAYSIQIYFDFSGYSDMAIGLGRIFGFEFRENFDYPYVARAVTEFWRRWHLSLSTWFRDYLYIPLGGNRLGVHRTYLNLFAVFALCGLWHGASWNFLLWGAWHGTHLALERAWLGTVLAKVPRVLTHLYTLLVVAFGWVLFRANSLPDAIDYLSALVGANSVTGGQPLLFFLDNEIALVLCAAAIGSTPWPRLTLERIIASVPVRIVVPGLLAGTATLLLLCGAKVASGAYSPFIYFRF
jgi:alginate O-acetyltransferase complex protein AlgI